jgi:hypothetical protein
MLSDLITKNNECSICWNELSDDIITLSCNHIFHNSCIDIWKKYNSSCPMCREPFNIKLPIIYFDELIANDGKIDFLTVNNFHDFYYLLPNTFNNLYITQLIEKIKLAKTLKNSLLIFNKYKILGVGVFNYKDSEGILIKITQINYNGTFACAFQMENCIKYYHSNQNTFELLN